MEQNSRTSIDIDRATLPWSHRLARPAVRADDRNPFVFVSLGCRSALAYLLFLNRA